MTAKEKRIIREYYGHGQGNRRVRIKNNGEVNYYGSTNPTERGYDYWMYGGTTDEVLWLAKTGRNNS